MSGEAEMVLEQIANHSDAFFEDRMIRYAEPVNEGEEAYEIEEPETLRIYLGRIADCINATPQERSAANAYLELHT